MDKINIFQNTIEYVFRRPVEPNGWVRAAYISRDTNGKYHIGLDKITISEEEVDERLSMNEIAELEKKLSVGEGNTLWLIKTGECYIARKENPIEDPNKRWVGRQSVAKLD